MHPRLIFILLLSVATSAAAPARRDLVGSWRLTGPEDYQRGVAEYRVILSASGEFRFEIHRPNGRTESETGRWRILDKKLLELDSRDPKRRPPPTQFDIYSVSRNRLLARDGPWEVTFDRIH